MHQANHSHQNIYHRFMLSGCFAAGHKLGARFLLLALAGATTNAITTDLLWLFFEPRWAQDSKKGQTQGRVAQGNLIITVIETHRKPKQLMS